MMHPGLLTSLVRIAAANAALGRDEGVADAAEFLAARADVLDVVAACRVLAEPGRLALVAEHGTPDVTRGESWVLDEGTAAGQPEQLFAGRFLTAYANHDHDMVLALAAACHDAGRIQCAACLHALATFAAQLAAQAPENPSNGQNRNRA